MIAKIELKEVLYSEENLSSDTNIMEEVPLCSKRKMLAAAVIMALCLQLLTIPAMAAENQYIVRRGDNLWVIAQRLGTTVSELKTANNLTTNIIIPNQVLLLPGKPAAASAQQLYTVRGGDNLWTIAQRNGVELDVLRQANGISGSLIYPGQKLIIPRGKVQLASRGSTGGNREEVYWLARAISAEAKGEPLLGQVAVGAVILNRVKDPYFPNSVRDVIFQKVNGVYQFSPVQNGTIYRTPAETAYQAAERALSGEDPTNGALYFYNPDITGRSNWIRTRPVARVVKNHVFAL